MVEKERTQQQEKTEGASLPVFEFWVEGVSPLLQHNPSGMGVSQEGVSRGKNIPNPEDEAEGNAYRMEDGSLYIPSTSFRAAILYACKGRTVGPKQYLTTLMPPAIFNVDTATPLIDPESGEYISTYSINAARVKVAGSGVMRHRPEISPWGARVYFEVDEGAVPIHVIEEVFNIAGRIAGVGDWRPQKIPNSQGFGGPYGRFTASLIGRVGD